MTALPNLSKLSLGGGGGGDEKEEAAPLHTGVVVDHQTGGPSQKDFRTAFSQILGECPVRVSDYSRIPDLVPFAGSRVRIRERHKGNVLELGLATQSLRAHFERCTWPANAPLPAPQSTDDNFVYRWLMHSVLFQNVPTSVVGATESLHTLNYPPAAPRLQGIQLGTPNVGYHLPTTGVLRSANETALMSTKKPQKLSRSGTAYSMALYNELWFLNTKQAQKDLWPQLKTDLENLVGGTQQIGPTDPRVLARLKQCLSDILTTAQQYKPLYLYGGNAIQSVMNSQYVDLDPRNPARKRAFFFARRSNHDEFKAFGEVVPLHVEHNEPEAERRRARDMYNAARQLAQQTPTMPNVAAEAQAKAYMERVESQMGRNATVAPWFTLELQQMDVAGMCQHTDWTALHAQSPINIGNQNPLNMIFAYLAPPEDINTNPLFGDANMHVPWPDDEEGEVDEAGTAGASRLTRFRGMSLYETIRAIERARAAAGS